MPTPNRLSLTSVAEDDEPLQRMELMSPTIPEDLTPAETTAVEAHPAPAPPAPEPRVPRVVRQSREVAAALKPAAPVRTLAQLREQIGTKENKDQISAWIKSSVNSALEAAVRDAEAQGIKKLTKSKIVEEAIAAYLGLPSDL